MLISNGNPWDLSTIVYQSDILVLIPFLAIYFLGHFVLSFVVGNRSYLIMDIIVLFLFICVCVWALGYYGKTTEESLRTMYKMYIEYLSYPSILVSEFLFLIIVYGFVFAFQLPVMGTISWTMWNLEGLAWFHIFATTIIFFFQYIIGVDIVSWLLGLPTSPTEPTPLQPAEPVTKEEVFHIGPNMFTYEEAKAVCQSYGARLANYDDVETTYQSGGEWCQFGWSENQNAFYPTQKSTYKKLQASPETANMCGRPGVNGGHFANPYFKFGANCYGVKPAPTPSDLERMKQWNNYIPPKTQQQTLLEKKVSFWKDNSDQFLKLYGFNSHEWSDNPMATPVVNNTTPSTSSSTPKAIT